VTGRDGARAEAAPGFTAPASLRQNQEMTTTGAAQAVRDLADPGLYVNRELSWLEFNARVLALAREPSVPLLERCKFLAIFSSNLDEFFMVRVAAVRQALEAGRKPSTFDRMPREEVLARIAERVHELVLEQARIWTEEVRPALREEGIAIVAVDELDRAQAAAVEAAFKRQVFPVLTPLAVGPGLPFPYISGLSLNLGLTVRDPTDGESRFARVKVPTGLPRFMPAGDVLVPLEQVIEAHLDRLFPGMEIVRSVLFRVTRDADFSISDEADDLLGAVEAQLRRRRFGDVVRLEVEAGAPEELLAEIAQGLGVTARETYHIPRPLDLTCLWQIATLNRPELRDPPWEPRTPPRLRGEGGDGGADLFAVIRRGDVLVHHPYDDFSTSVGRFIEQAVDDPDVLAIKQTLYRTSGDTPILPGLIRAAEQGKQTVCLVELQARFDEERNIRWARALERAGVHVVYGLVGLKTHAKLAMVVRREGDGVRRYVHIGTGNYNPATAELYTDLGLFTCREDICEDVADLFNYLTGFAHPPAYRKVLVAPAHLRDGIIGEIERVAEAHRAGVPGRLVMKLNALVDGPVIQALYRASQAGVPVDLILRGICGLRPGVPGVSETVRVTSIVGRFLEHSRIFAFYSGAEARYFIGSADMMARNLDHRVELVTPVEDPLAQAELQEILDVMLADTALAWRMHPDGSWTRVEAPPGEPPLDSQRALMERAVRRSEERLAR
jgi:polyphosphate kinase